MMMSRTILRGQLCNYSMLPYAFWVHIKSTMKCSTSKSGILFYSFIPSWKLYLVHVQQ